MAELNQSTNKAQKKTVRPLPKVDLTAMVDLAFLLITFFMLTTSISKPTAMDVAMPVGPVGMPVSEDRTMTVCLGANNKTLWYMGTTHNPQNIHLVDPSKIRSVFQQQMKRVLIETGKNIIVLIKPDEKSNFRNLVDVLDELTIVDAPAYAIVDITSEDKELLARQKGF